MKNIIDEYRTLNSYAVVGASRNKDKYGYIIFKKLLDGGKKVFPINPGASEIDGVKAYPSIMDIPDTIDAVHFITPPKITYEVSKKCIELGIKYVWMQPGAQSDIAIELLEENGVNVIHNACILVF